MQNAIILGDFNMHIEDLTDNNSKIFVDIMEVLGLQQHVNQLTHKKGNILDLIFTEVTSKINLRELEMLDFISDHQLISATTDVQKKAPTQDHKKENQKPQRSEPNYTNGQLSTNRSKSEHQHQ